MFADLAGLLAYRAAHGPAGPRLCVVDKTEMWLSYVELLERARRVAGGLRAKGVRAGDKVGITMSTGLDFIDAFFGCQFAGAIPVAFAADQHGSDTRVAHIVATTKLVTTIDAAAIAALRTCPPLYDGARCDTAFIQFTSGSTRAPRGVVISQHAAIANTRGIAKALESDDSDVLVAWLPLSHDMGLVGTLLAPLVSGAKMVLMSPEYFISDAGRRFLRLTSKHRGSVWVMPPFAYRLLARRMPAPEIRLDSVRVALVGAEMITQGAIDAFLRVFEPIGFDRNALTPAYGLAESTLAVTFRKGMRFERGYAVLGTPIDGTELRIRDGEIQVRGASLMAGYENDSTDVFDDGWLRTGDLGFLHDGELVMCGRAKDLIKRGGRSFFGTDIEAALMHVEGTNAAAVFAAEGRDGTETAVALVETRAWRDPEVLARLRESVYERAGITIEEIVLVRPWSLPRTTSGKLVLPACKELQYASAV